MSLSLHHIAINVVTPAATAAFYADAVGFAALPPADDGPSWVAGPNAYLALYPANDGNSALQNRRVCDPGIGHFCLQSANGMALWQSLNDRGMAFNDRPVALGTGAIYAYGRDPDHSLVEVEGVATAEPHTPIWIAHVALVTPDIERLSDFYARLLGQDAPRAGRFANKLFENITGLADVDVSARWIDAENFLIELWQYHNPPTGPVAPPAEGAAGYRYIGFSCANLNAAIARLAKLGIHIERGQAIAGYATGWGRDPDGNRFAIMEIGAGPSALSLANLSDPAIVTRRRGII